MLSAGTGLEDVGRYLRLNQLDELLQWHPFQRDDWRTFMHHTHELSPRTSLLTPDLRRTDSVRSANVGLRFYLTVPP